MTSDERNLIYIYVCHNGCLGVFGLSRHKFVYINQLDLGAETLVDWYVCDAPVWRLYRVGSIQAHWFYDFLDITECNKLYDHSHVDPMTDDTVAPVCAGHQLCGDAASNRKIRPKDAWLGRRGEKLRLSSKFVGQFGCGQGQKWQTMSAPDDAIFDAICWTISRMLYYKSALMHDIYLYLMPTSSNFMDWTSSSSLLDTVYTRFITHFDAGSVLNASAWYTFFSFFNSHCICYRDGKSLRDGHLLPQCIEHHAARI